MKLHNNDFKTDSRVCKLYNSARKQGLTRNIKWLQRLIGFNRVFFMNHSDRKVLLNGPIVKKKFIEKLSQLIKIFENKFPNNWDIHLEYSAQFKAYEICFIIHYDKIKISNSRKQSRILTDLVVVLPISYNAGNVYVRSIDGTRLTMSRTEWSSGYKHSHLCMSGKIQNLNSVFAVSKFCIGTEDLAELRDELAVDFDVDKFELFLYTIDSLVAWESIEGGPYISIDKLIEESSDTIIEHSDMQITSLYQIFARNVFIDVPHLPLDFVFSSGRFRIKPNSKCEDFIRKLILNSVEIADYIPRLLCKRGTDNNFYTDIRLLGSLSNNLNNSEVVLQSLTVTCEGELPFIYIQGKKIHFDIQSSEMNPVSIEDFIIYPKFLDYVIKQLESKIYKICVEGSSFNRLSNTSTNVQTLSGQS